MMKTLKTTDTKIVDIIIILLFLILRRLLITSSKRFFEIITVCKSKYLSLKAKLKICTTCWRGRQ
jgi:hypothetical protein